MSKLLETIEKLHETQAAIKKLEQVALNYPDLPSVAVNMRSLQQRQEDLESFFEELAHEEYLDVLRYRVFSESDDTRVSLPALTNTLGDFQKLFTNVYGAIKEGAKQRSRVGAEIVAATTFEFGYSFAGSVGFVFALQNERLLTDETNLDRAMDVIFQMAKAQDSDDIFELAKDLGVAPIRAMYRWVSDHIESGLGADIDWRREHDSRVKLFAQVPELKIVQQAINQTSEEKTEEFSAYGELLGADVSSQTFHMKMPEGLEIKGRLALDVTEDSPVAVPRYYKGSFRKTTTISYATEEEKTVYLLLSLQER